MHARITLLSGAIAALFTPFATLAQQSQQEAEATLPSVSVTASPLAGEEQQQILTPAKVLSGQELRDKLGTSLGDTLSRELGVSSTGYGAGASRPVIRGMEGSRVKILQNGMAVSDVSGMSNDHAVATESATARQIEILRGPAALLYGSGAIGGLVNVVNERIPTELPDKPTGEAELRYGSVNQEKNASVSADGASGQIGLHVDANWRDSSDYKIPGYARAGDTSSAYGRLPSSYSEAASLGLGGALIGERGHLGASLGSNRDRYGVPTAERSFIKLWQDRLDLDGLLKAPLPGFDTLRVRIGISDYRHTEYEEDGTAATHFKNKAWESRLELAHQPWAGWRGKLGIQSEHSRFSALAADGSGPSVVPPTTSNSIAAFLVEERDFGPLRASAGARLESAERKPQAGSGLPDRQFTLASTSLGGLWQFLPGYGLGGSVSFAQRAPSIEELYSNGPHESTATFDIGNPNLNKERSRNIEISLQKTAGLLRWKANLYHNRIHDFIYGRFDGISVDESGAEDVAGTFKRRTWTPGQAVIRGLEAEVSYNVGKPGVSARTYGDTSRGVLEQGGNLPLQPASRVGFELGYRQGGWRSGLSVLHAFRQNRLADTEAFVTPAYTRTDANISYTQYYKSTQITWFAVVRNLFNQDIRLATSVLKEEAPQAGRNVLVGVRSMF